MNNQLELEAVFHKLRGAIDRQNTDDVNDTIDQLAPSTLVKLLSTFHDKGFIILEILLQRCHTAAIYNLLLSFMKDNNILKSQLEYQSCSNKNISLHSATSYCRSAECFRLYVDAIKSIDTTITDDNDSNNYYRHGSFPFLRSQLIHKDAQGDTSLHTVCDSPHSAPEILKILMFDTIVTAGGKELCLDLLWSENNKGNIPFSNMCIRRPDLIDTFVAILEILDPTGSLLQKQILHVNKNGDNILHRAVSLAEFTAKNYLTQESIEPFQRLVEIIKKRGSHHDQNADVFSTTTTSKNNNNHDNAQLLASLLTAENKQSLSPLWILCKTCRNLDLFALVVETLREVGSLMISSSSLIRDEYEGDGNYLLDQELDKRRILINITSLCENVVSDEETPSDASSQENIQQYTTPKGILQHVLLASSVSSSCTLPSTTTHCSTLLVFAVSTLLFEMEDLFVDQFSQLTEQELNQYQTLRSTTTGLGSVDFINEQSWSPFQEIKDCVIVDPLTGRTQLVLLYRCSPKLFYRFTCENDISALFHAPNILCRLFSDLLLAEEKSPGLTNNNKQQTYSLSSLFCTPTIINKLLRFETECDVGEDFPEIVNFLRQLQMLFWVKLSELEDERESARHLICENESEARSSMLDLYKRSGILSNWAQSWF